MERKSGFGVHLAVCRRRCDPERVTRPVSKSPFVNGVAPRSRTPDCWSARVVSGAARRGASRESHGLTSPGGACARGPLVDWLASGPWCSSSPRADSSRAVPLAPRFRKCSCWRASQDACRFGSCGERVVERIGLEGAGQIGALRHHGGHGRRRPAVATAQSRVDSLCFHPALTPRVVRQRWTGS